jgi:hypothetical protein
MQLIGSNFADKGGRQNGGTDDAHSISLLLITRSPVNTLYRKNSFEQGKSPGEVIVNAANQQAL